MLQQLPTLDASELNSIDASGLALGACVGPYRLKREIGRGGMADVWLAERADGAFERDVALNFRTSAVCGAISRRDSRTSATSWRGSNTRISRASTTPA